MPLIIASFSGLYGYGRMFDLGTVVSTVRGSQYLNGETSYMVVNNTDSFRMSTMDFTIEWFQYIQLLNTIPRIFSIGNFPSPSLSVSFSTFISSVTTDIFLPTDPIFVWPSTSSSLIAVSNAIDGLSSTVYRNNTKYGSGFVVRPLAGASIVTQLAFITAGNLPECDPITFTLEGSNDAISIVPPVTTPAWVDSTLLFFLPFNGDPVSPASYTDAGPNRNNFPRLGGSLITIGGRIAYNGASQGGNVLLLNLAVNNVTHATYSAWVYLLATPSGARGVIFSRSNSNTGVCGINFNGSSLFHHWNDGYFGQSSNVIPPLNTWTHIAVVITPTASFWYQNGSLVETKTQNYSVANLSNFYIGNDNPAVAGDRNFNGYIDDAMFAIRAYTSAEIASIYTNSIADHTGLPSGGSGGSPSSFTTSTNLNTVNWTTIVANQPTNCSLTRFSKSFSAVFMNTAVYNAYRIRFPMIRDGGTATFVQIGEVEMLGSIVNNFANVWMNSTIVMNALTSTLLYDTWAHFALTRSTNTIRLFQNGFQIGSTLTSTINLTDAVNPLLIGTTFDATNSVAPILTAIAPISVSGTSIIFRGSIDSTGGITPQVRGFVWSVNPTPTIALSTRVQESGLFLSGSYTLSTSSLLPSTTYYIRAFATNSVETGYSSQITFTTDFSAPIISSISATNISNNSSLVIAQIVATGGHSVTVRGIAWDLLPDPTVSLSTTRSEVGVFNQPGFFSTFATGLSSQGTFYTRPFATNLLGLSYGDNLTIVGGLYPFTSFTFTNATQQGAQGPTLATCQSAYSAASWTQNTSFFNVITRGIQEWTVPRTASYAIELAGATGGFRTSLSGTARPGYGYRISGVLSLTQGQVVRIVVGQRGVGVTSSSVSGSQGCGGGGATCVYVGSTLMMIAAGGNGQSWETHSVPDPDGRATGQTVTLTSQGRGWQGATFSVNGDGSAAAALAILNGAVGGNANGAYAATGTYSVGNGQLYGGGFGGGGGTNPFEGGGGGGFQGGITKGTNDYTGTYLNQGAVSFMHASVTSQTNIGTNASGSVSDPTSLHGYCIVNLLEPVTLFTTAATSITGTTAVSGGNVISLGSSVTLTLRGIVWSTSPSPTIALSTKVQESGSFGTGTFSFSITGLLGGTTYYIRSYVSGSGGFTYGDEKEFTTALSAPFLSTISATALSGGSTTVLGSVVATGGSTLGIRGFVWDTNSTPTILLSTQTSQEGTFSTGFYSSMITGLLTPPYYIQAFGTNGVGVGYGNNLFISAALYAFTTFTFTNAGVTGRTGPTLSQCRSAYSAAAWTQNSVFFNMTIQGIQEWTVPQTGNYLINALGARGGGQGGTTPGLGARMQDTFSLVQGEVIRILVGQMGSDNPSLAAGGGGGTFVVRSPFNTNGSILIIAAGGGGSEANPPNSTSRTFGDGDIVTAGRSGLPPVSSTGSGAGGTNGNGGGTATSDNCGGGGGGFFTNGATNTGWNNGGGGAFVNGGLGGTGNNPGGFGGGGGASGNGNSGGGPGAGGGYSGGGGGDNVTQTIGGGGGSIDNGLNINQVQTIGANSGHGQVTITLV